MNELAELHLENANLWILVLDFETLDCEEVIASDFNRFGCRVQSKKLKTLDQHIGLRVSGFEKMIKGRVSKILEDEVVVSFEFNDDTQSEKRKERRRPVSITARVSSGAEGDKTVKCEIIDASLSGCRLSSDTLYTLPDDICLRISGIDLPVQGQIMWRGAGVAGVRMLWEFSGKNELRNKTSNSPHLIENANREQKKPRRSSGDFGVKRRN